MGLPILIKNTYKYNAVKYNTITQCDRKTDNLTPVTGFTKSNQNRYQK